MKVWRSRNNILDLVVCIWCRWGSDTWLPSRTGGQSQAGEGWCYSLIRALHVWMPWLEQHTTLRVQDVSQGLHLHVQHRHANTGGEARILSPKASEKLLCQVPWRSEAVSARSRGRQAYSWLHRTLPEWGREDHHQRLLSMTARLVGMGGGAL